MTGRIFRRRLVYAAMAALALVATCVGVAVVIGMGLAEAAWLKTPPDMPVDQILTCSRHDATGRGQEANLLGQPAPRFELAIPAAIPGS